MNYSEFEKEAESRGSQKKVERKYGFFPKMEDGATIYARFLVGRAFFSSDAAVLRAHTNVKATFNGKDRFITVKCLREHATDSFDTCPFCYNAFDSNIPNDNPDKISKPSNVTELPLLIYETTDDGKVEVKPVVWERKVSSKSDILKELRDLMDENELDSLTELLVAIKRNGTRLDTKYTINAAGTAKQNKPEFAFRQDVAEEAFKDFDPVSRLFVKDSNEMKNYIITGEFPSKAKSQETKEEVEEIKEPIREETTETFERPARAARSF